MFGLGMGMVLIGLTAPPEVHPPSGKEQTTITGPRDKDGNIDYEAGLNDLLSKGVTPENNANVLIWKALGPKPEGKRMIPDYFRRLGIEEPPEHGRYFVALHSYGREVLKLDDPASQQLEEELRAAGSDPWKAADHPRIAAWLQANVDPLALLIAASKRPEYYNPLVYSKGEEKYGNLIWALLPTPQKCRAVIAAFTARAMLRLGEGDPEGAWENLLAAHRLARLVGSGGSLIEGLVGVASQTQATNSTLVYLDRAGLTATQLRNRLKDLDGMPAPSSLARRVDLTERYMILDATAAFARGKTWPTLMTAPELGPEEVKLLRQLDWPLIYRIENEWFDRFVASLRIVARSERVKALQQIESDIKALKPAKIEDVLDLEADTPERRKVVSRRLAESLVKLLLPSISKVNDAEDRAVQQRINLRLAFLIALYRADTGRYPAKLDDLSPKYLAKIPLDIFSDKPLIFKPDEKGYLLYSVGVNGKDDNGQSYGDTPGADDLVVRMPVPKKAK